MDGYEIHIEEVSQGATQLQQIIEGLEAQMNQIKSISDNMLNDALWYGPNKSSFMNRLNDYMTQVQGLYNNAVEHHTRLLEIIQTYANAES